MRDFPNEAGIGLENETRPLPNLPLNAPRACSAHGKQIIERRAMAGDHAIAVIVVRGSRFQEAH